MCNSRMKLGVELSTFVLLLACCFHLTMSVPWTYKKLEDPCDLVELENIPTCEADDKDCEINSAMKREKRQTLCETYPNCSYCGALIPGDLEYDEVVPEVVEPTYEINLNSTDEDGNAPEELRSQPTWLIERNIIIENDNETQYYRGYVESGANITTVIRLTNMINNTNIINMPTTLNNTNINNIHIYQNKSSESGGKFGLGYTEQGPCCFNVGPKSCKQSTAGTKCRHSRKKVCGRQCTKKVIHPQRNPCIPQWPYMGCQPNQFQPPPPSYNPGFYPPPQGYPGFYPQIPQLPNELDDDDDDDDLPLFPDDEELDNPDNGWIVGPEKCKVVSEDGLQISNCTQKGVEFDHPFARNTASEPIKRNVRQANYHGGQQNQMMQQPALYYPVMFQPIYIQAVPMFVPQYYAQPQQQQPPNFYGPQQLSIPPYADQDTYYIKDEESNDINAYQEKPRKHSRKHHPVVMDIDEEL